VEVAVGVREGGGDEELAGHAGFTLAERGILSGIALVHLIWYLLQGFALEGEVLSFASLYRPETWVTGVRGHG